jgi:hypothetical protein
MVNKSGFINPEDNLFIASLEADKETLRSRLYYLI